MRFRHALRKGLTPGEQSPAAHEAFDRLRLAGVLRQTIRRLSGDQPDGMIDAAQHGGAFPERASVRVAHQARSAQRGDLFRGVRAHRQVDLRRAGRTHPMTQAEVRDAEVYIIVSSAVAVTSGSRLSARGPDGHFPFKSLPQVVQRAFKVTPGREAVEQGRRQA